MFHQSILIQGMYSDDFIVPFLPTGYQLEHPDVLFVNRAGEGIGIDEVRVVLSSMIEQPYQSDYKIYVIASLDQATPEAQQALLKALEEPPKHVQFMVVTEHPSLLLPTILSRLTMIENHLSQQTNNHFSPREKNSGDSQRDEGNPSLIFSQPLKERLEWASQATDAANATQLLYQLLEETQKTLELTPSLQDIAHLKKISKSFEYLRANVQPKLVLEWVVM